MAGCRDAGTDDLRHKERRKKKKKGGRKKRKKERKGEGDGGEGGVPRTRKYKPCAASYFTVSWFGLAVRR